VAPTRCEQRKTAQNKWGGGLVVCGLSPLISIPLVLAMVGCVVLIPLGLPCLRLIAALALGLTPQVKERSEPWRLSVLVVE